jgi:hypothetical protein
MCVSTASYTSIGFKIALHKLIQLHEEKTSNSLEQSPSWEASSPLAIQEVALI